MQLRSKIKLDSMIKAMKDVVIPAIDTRNELAIQQAHLIVGLLTLMVHQLPVQFRFDRDELQRLIDCARGLAALSSDEQSVREAAVNLDTCRIAAEGVLVRCAGDPTELTAAVRAMREATGTLMAAAASGADTAALGVVQNAVLSLSREQLLRDRALMLPQGWEPDPTAIPDIQSLLPAVTGNP